MTGDELAQGEPARGSVEEPAWPCSGTVGGVPFVALPPTAVDAPTRDGLIVCWHAFDPPRTEAAMAAALPMTGVPVWRVYLGLRSPDPAEHDYLQLLASTVERAAAELPEVVAALREPLGLGDGAVGLAGHGEGAMAALLVLAEQRIPVSAAALIAPVWRPERVIEARERRLGAYSWTPETLAIAERLDLADRVDDIARADPRLLLVGGASDLLVPVDQVEELRRLLGEAGAASAESVTFRMGHALAAEPGVEPRAPLTAAVSVDAALTDWFRRHLGTNTPKASRPLAVNLG
ncbi:hypothetical protein ABGB12_18785 [Actinocorallia sp. B10E7]|uniref:alpha/beta hydrolase family protein n=1 Tax=Actinocorallia sp. B10E7 TaxID=3153558 RepID=UPI00325DACC7